MRFLRSRLHRLVLVWLVCQGASLSAFLPAECCASHSAHAGSAQDCHGEQAGLCPMKAATGDECPMHASPAVDAATHESMPDCVMGAVCRGPATALSLLIPIAGVLTDLPRVADARMTAPVESRTFAMMALPQSHDTPPPRL